MCKLFVYDLLVYRARGPLWAHVGPIMETCLQLPEVYSERSALARTLSLEY
jgi:hypothetical protein